ncbi:MAG: hypothetical protein GX963_14440 [Bacteroidales bacterium]|nr:hypothetical protein [Bacteroidales bacterium]
MPKIPIKPIWEFSKKHYKEIGTALGAAGKVGWEFRNNRKENQKEKGKVPFRKERFMQLKMWMLITKKKLLKQQLAI